LDVVIDFTSPEATMKHAVWCAENAVALVVGTTGLSSEDLRGLDEVSKRIPVVQAPNMSVGVNVLCTLVEQAAEMLGESFDLEIVETHHRHKTDAPSGTALRLLDVVQRVRPEGLARFERHGDIGPRGQQEIGVQTLRGGDVVGDHTVFLFGSGERLELTHRATDRSIFAAGAVRAAQWAVQQPAGRYTMRDVLLG
jgi:4-hydroxy-tetrahydrodipicolinate reductase